MRHYTKWDDEPGSVEACLDSITRAYKIATTPPFGPTYVVLDVAMQEEKLAQPLPMPDLERFAAPAPPVPAPADVKRAIEIMRAAKHPVMLVGRSSRDVAAYNDRVALAEALGARVISDFRAGSVFPTAHPLHVGKSSTRVTEAGVAVLKEADAILSLESYDLGGMLNQVFGKSPQGEDHPAIDRFLRPQRLEHGSPNRRAVRSALRRHERTSRERDARRTRTSGPQGRRRQRRGEGRKLQPTARRAARWEWNRSAMRSPRRLPAATSATAAFRSGSTTARRSFSIIRWIFSAVTARGGVGAGPGIAVGAALALKGTGRLPVSVLGDGDYLMGLTALWTAVANEIPLLVIVANNNCYNNDVAHQDRIARTRSRPVERKWIGQMITEPAPDLAMLARGQGAIGIGRIDGRENIGAAIAEGIKHVEAGKVCVIDVYVSPDLDQRRKAEAAAQEPSKR